MIELSGKSLIFTDLHIGLKNDSISRINIINKVIYEIISSIKENKIDNIIFLGDLFHTRSSINVNTMNMAIDIMKVLSSLVKTIVLIVGNHDIYYKSKTDVNSVKIFENLTNVILVEKLEEGILNGQSVLFVPWAADFSTISQTKQYDIMFGHFDIPANYLIRSYIEDNKAKKLSAQKVVIDLIEQNSVFINCEDVNNIIESNKSSCEYIGNFVEFAKPKGRIFSGHIHKAKTFFVKNKVKFTFVGAPYEQTLGDVGNECGYIILDENNIDTKILITNIPKHIIIKNSEILKNKQNYKKYFKELGITSNIIKRIIDEELPRDFSLKVNDIISELKPYEELPVEYIINKILVNPLDNSDKDQTLTDSIKTSKADYISEYINLMDDAELKEKGIEKSKLFEIFHEYIRKNSI